LERMIRTDPGQWTVLQPIWAAPHARAPLAEALGSIPAFEEPPSDPAPPAQAWRDDWRNAQRCRAEPLPFFADRTRPDPDHPV